MTIDILWNNSISTGLANWCICLLTRGPAIAGPLDQNGQQHATPNE